LAIADYSKVIEQNPKDPEAYNNRGNAFFDNLQYDLAIADYTKAIELNPKYAEAYYHRGNVYVDKLQFDQAIADLKTCISLSPTPDLNDAANKLLAQLPK
jgi:tetratricopeptide (TPR) repeat protein